MLRLLGFPFLLGLQTTYAVRSQHQVGREHEVEASSKDSKASHLADTTSSRHEHQDSQSCKLWVWDSDSGAEYKDATCMGTYVGDGFFCSRCKAEARHRWRFMDT
eukprot:TRINITY_DN102095_c0_g1_i1.p2 TRINITY_DN102095_c0_g1~~TRINITY_DN102095_c0_g1_i1.p2  ORF type:complete len:105 (+),score=12.31 TRINITY_DN102095_c0_g1_i1:69-383(+)